MLPLKQEIESAIRSWAETALDHLPEVPLIQPCRDLQFGHYQSNLAMAAAKQARKPPREIAANLVEFCQDQLEGVEVDVAGPGFVNFRLSPDHLARSIRERLENEKGRTEHRSTGETVVVDYSSPNVAKEMHVGHIRSSILGESLSRVLEALGHRVIRDNHIGDWGTQFGKMILGIKRDPSCLDAPQPLQALEDLYRQIHAECESNEATLAAARAELKKLQDGDPENQRIWEDIRSASQGAFDAIYERLGIRFDHTLGESFYNPLLKGTVEELRRKGIAQESEGATVVFFNDPDLKDSPMVVEKSDGAALYSTTDIATLRYRVDEWRADRVIYVTDGRQQLHFKQLFAIAARLELPGRFDHVWFGAILDQSKKPLKTREGTPIRLRELLDEAEERASRILLEKRPDLEPDRRKEMARVIGIGALKYADLAQNRNLDYVFDWDKLLSFDGNTAPYLLNAYVRTRSILRKKPELVPDGAVDIHLQHPVEQELAWHLLNFATEVENVGRDLKPHTLCQFLYEAAVLFHRFFEHCPVLNAESEKIRSSRLALCSLTGSTLQNGMHLLGLETLEEM